jgi:small-conductance mechanosensitive channel
MRSGEAPGGIPRLHVLWWVALVLLLAAGPALPQGRTAEPARESGGAAPPGPIPVAEIARQVGEVGEFLRSVDEALAPSSRIESIEAELPALSRRIEALLDETRKALDSRPSLGKLDGLSETWQATRLGIAASIETLTAQAIRLDGQRARLATLKDTWSLTRRTVRQTEAPGPILERIDAVLAAIETARKRVETARAASLALQDRVARELSRCEDALAELAQARRHAAGELFVREGPPIWQVQPLTTSEAAAALRSTAESLRAAVEQMIRDQSGGMAGHAALVLGLVAVFWLARRRARAQPPDASATSLGPLLEHPIAAALVLGLLVSFWIYAAGPRVARTLAEIGALVPLVVILRGLVAPRLLPGLYFLAAFFLVDRLRGLLIGLPRAERYVLLLEMLAGAAVLVWLFPRGRAQVLVASMGSAIGRMVHAALVLAFTGFVIAFVLAVIGHVSLARLVASGIFASGFLALALEAGRHLANGLASFALRVPPLRGLGMVEHHRPLIEQRARAVFRGLGMVAWVMGTLNHFGLLTPAWDQARSALGAELTRGAFSISLGDVIAFALTVWLAFLLSSFVRFVLEEDVFPRVQLAPGLPYALSTLVRYAIVCVGIIVALLVLGVNLDRVTVLGGALGVGVGFGLQNIVNNFVSGLIVLFERPVRVGDAIQIGDVQGVVRRIGIRASTVAGWEGAEVIVPNSMLVAQQVINWTPSVYRRRLDIQVNVAYGTAPEEVLKVLADVAAAHPDVAAAPPPEALFLGFGESALRFELRAWTARLDRHVGVKSELGVAVYAALRKAGMTIPFPQQEVRLHPAPPPGPADGATMADQDREADRPPGGGRV